MNAVFIVLTVQIVLGAFDNFWHHELTQRLPARRSARGEIALHATREFVYAGLFLALAWATWNGTWAYVLVSLFALEIAVTLADFVIEDRTRKLPALERVLHTLLAMNVGIFMAVFIPVAWQWSLAESDVVAVDYGNWSLFLTFAACGVGLWAIRDAIAAISWLRPPYWVRQPLVIGDETSARTVLVTGATGFIGQATCRALLERGDRVIVLTRDKAKARDRFGDHVRVITDLAEIDCAQRVDCVINLAGAPVAGWPWTTRRRRKLIDSRVNTTNAVIELIGRLTRKPDVLISASAIGYYGVHGEKRLIETDKPGDGFQAQLCREWEAAAMKVTAQGVRVCLVRFGLVLGRNAGILPQLAMPLNFKCNLVFGSGDQWVSWIHIQDAVRLILFAIDTPTISGAINATAPRPVRHAEFMADLGKRRRSLVRIRIPAIMLRTLLGELAELFVDGQKVVPLAAPALGFKFRFEKLPRALDDLLNEESIRSSIDVFYDAACPVCNTEIEHYRKACDVSGARIGFKDVSATDNPAHVIGLPSADARKRLYARTQSGEIKSGVDALIEIWRRLPAYTWISRLAKLPGVHAALEMFYDLLAAPLVSAWSARRRRRLSNGETR